MELWRKTWRIGFAGWQGGCGISTVGDVEEFFARVCHEADERLKEVAGCRWFLNWYDDTPRGEMRRELLAEVEQELRRREALTPAAAPATMRGTDEGF